MSNFDPTSPEGSASTFEGNTNLQPPAVERRKNVSVMEAGLAVEDMAQMQLPEITEEETSSEATGKLAIPIKPKPIIEPRPPIIKLKNKVFGRYRGTNGFWQLELRIDIDGTRPMNRISGDFYQIAGMTTLYFGSFSIDMPSVSFTSSIITVEGTGNFTYATGYPKIKVTITRTPIYFPLAAASIQFFSPSNTPGAIYTCQFESRYFRKVQYEIDRVSDVTTPIFNSYNTGSLPSGGPARNLSVTSAYAESGIELQTSGVSDVIPIGEAGANVSWSNSELHAAMVAHFSLWADVPHWKVWQLVAQLHDLGPGLYGIMFDQQGKQRQGCAVFHKGIGGTTPDKLRLQLYTYVHELGHSFNLLHSWQKSYAVPPIPNRPSALSWMNYPWNFPGGASAFWTAFPFQFDNQEVVHLRHAFRNNVIMGGNNFIIGSAISDQQAFADPVEDNSGLQLELESRRSFALGEPVVIEIKLRTTDTRGRQVHRHIHPNMGFVQIGIRKPGGQIMVYEPLMEHCMTEDTVMLDATRPSIYESAYIGYGKGGFYFDQNGFYQVRAVYFAQDGSQIVSNIISLRVRTPLSKEDEEVTDLFFGEDQGALLYLLGSDSDFLKNGNDAFDLVIDKYGKHPLSVYARLLKGINMGREFKSIHADKKVTLRKTRTDECISLLSGAITTSETGIGLDNITLNMTMRSMARAQKRAGDANAAKATTKHMVDFFRKKGLKPHVQKLIEEQAAEI